MLIVLCKDVAIANSLLFPVCYLKYNVLDYTLTMEAYTERPKTGMPKH